MQKGKIFLQTITVPALTAGQLKLYDEEVTLRNFRNYIPFRSMHVVNSNLTCNVEIMFDYQPERKIICLFNGIEDIKEQPFRAFSVKNLNAINAIAAGDVILQLETY